MISFSNDEDARSLSSLLTLHKPKVDLLAPRSQHGQPKISLDFRSAFVYRMINLLGVFLQPCYDLFFSRLSQ